MDNLSFLTNINSEEFEFLFQKYLKNKNSIDKSWHYFFQGYEFGSSNVEFENSSQLTFEKIQKELNVLELIKFYREKGHLFSTTDPLTQKNVKLSELLIKSFEINANDLENEFNVSSFLGLRNLKLKDTIAQLEKSYCSNVGVELMHISDNTPKEWLINKLEQDFDTIVLTDNEKIQLYNNLLKSVNFEKFLAKRFPAQKRFSLEGADNLIPAIYSLINYASENGATNIVFGMAHRGRLNMLANIFQKPVDEIFSEFIGKSYEDYNLLGDVKYHIGISSTTILENKNQVELILCHNPSHLEAVSSVVQGISRSILDNQYNKDYNRVLPIIIHGDASIAGQGVVYEQQQMSNLPAYTVGGIIHIVINNQIGFTTNNTEARSSKYCTDIAKITEAPVFHVNGDDLEAMVRVLKIALEYKFKFNKDCFIDIICYRRHGHNESDEPKFTHQELYNKIENHPNPLQIYTEKLLSQKVISKEFVTKLEKDFNTYLDNNFQTANQTPTLKIENFLNEKWKGFNVVKDLNLAFNIPKTRIDKENLFSFVYKLNTIPKEINIYGKHKQLFEKRIEMLDTDSIDWGLAEQIAFASILNDGTNIRFSGQDVQRGTFSHRHSVIKDENSVTSYVPLNNLSSNQANFEIYNSLLSEYAVLGFEYGYSLSTPKSLVLWEAQFGDFSNGAQIIIDQFISSGEEKWNVQNGIVMLLPHGYEGQGPEHSSARIERFLSLCANFNMEVVQCSTPANYFHSLRRQIIRNFRKPLISFTPKSLMRNKLCVSTVEEFTSSDFKMFIEEKEVNRSEIETLVFCSGKIYYEIILEKEKIYQHKMSFVRVEQLFPFSENKLDEIISNYINVKKLIWIQDEPANMGPWTFLSKFLLPRKFLLIARPVSSSPASGSFILHKKRFQKLIEKLFGSCVCERSKNECKMICMDSSYNNSFLK